MKNAARDLGFRYALSGLHWPRLLTISGIGDEMMFNSVKQFLFEIVVGLGGMGRSNQVFQLEKNELEKGIGKGLARVEWAFGFYIFSILAFFKLVILGVYGIHVNGYLLISVGVVMFFSVIQLFKKISSDIIVYAIEHPEIISNQKGIRKKGWVFFVASGVAAWLGVVIPLVLFI